MANRKASLQYATEAVLAGVSAYLNARYLDPQGIANLVGAAFNSENDLSDDFRRIQEVSTKNTETLPFLVMSMDLDSLNTDNFPNPTPAPGRNTAYNGTNAYQYRTIGVSYDARIYVTSLVDALAILDAMMVGQSASFKSSYGIDWLEGVPIQYAAYLGLPKIRQEKKLPDFGQIWSVRFKIKSSLFLVSAPKPVKVIKQINMGVYYWNGVDLADSENSVTQLLESFEITEDSITKVDTP